MRIGSLRQRTAANASSNQHAFKTIERTVCVDEIVSIKHDRGVVVMRVKPQIMPRVHREETVAGLKRAAGFLRSMLGARIKVHSTPELHFVYDESVESGIRLTHLIEEAVAADVARAKPRRRTPRSR